MTLCAWLSNFEMSKAGNYSFLAYIKYEVRAKRRVLVKSVQQIDLTVTQVLMQSSFFLSFSENVFGAKI